MSKRWVLLAVGCCVVLQAAFAVGGLQPSESRVIFNEGDKEQSVAFTNHSRIPVLVQAWTDDGDESLSAAGKEASFVVTPAVFRVDPDEAQVVRIFRSRLDKPADRESVAYLNVMYVDPAGNSPAARTGSLAAGVKLSIRHRIKVFFRPKALNAVVGRPMQPLEVHDLPADRAGAPGKLEIVNPGPFYVSLAGPIQLTSAHDKVDVVDGMFAPFEKRIVSIPAASRDTGGWARFVYRVVTDFGGTSTYEKPLSAR